MEKEEVKFTREQYLAFLEIYHHIRPYLNKELTVTKAELVKKFPKRKKMIEDIWVCVTELKLVWPYEIAERIFE